MPKFVMQQSFSHAPPTVSSKLRLLSYAWGCCAILASIIATSCHGLAQPLPPDSSFDEGYGIAREFDAEPDGYLQEGDFSDPCVDCGDGIAYGAVPQNGRSFAKSDATYESAWWPGMYNFGFRNSRTHPRWSGSGQPLSSTSWLNRPYEFGIDTGAFLMTNSVSSNSRQNNDVLLAAHLGWDWEHYWGTQLRVAYTTPELSTLTSATQTNSNTLMMYDLTMLYYPWGDSRVRPYYRFGVGLTDISFTNAAGNHEDNALFTVPVGVGIKYQTKRWMALRAEAIDHIVFAQNGASPMQNVTLTFGLEWRFGGRPTRGWSSPSQRRTW